MKHPLSASFLFSGVASLGLFGLLSIAIHDVAAKENTSLNNNEGEIRVGTYDSRLVAVAYVRSNQFKERLSKLKVQMEAAKKAKNEKRVKEIETQAVELQHHVHKQGFSTFPVHDILKPLKAKLPEIASKAKVDIIVSKWEINYQRSGVQTVDVTDLLVALFKPDEKTKKILDDLRTKAPVPLNQIKKH